MQQFEINNYIKKQIIEYLDAKQCDLHTAMNDEQMNRELAAILHKGFPTMIQKFYSLKKFEPFLWEKREFLYTHIQARLDALNQTK